MWNNLTYELGLKVLNKEIDDFDLALELMPKNSKNKSKDFAKMLSLDTVFEPNLENYQVPTFFMFRKVPKKLVNIKFERIIKFKHLLSGDANFDVFKNAGQIVSIVLDVDIEKINKRKFIDIVGLAIFFLKILKKL